MGVSWELWDKCLDKGGVADAADRLHASLSHFFCPLLLQEGYSLSQHLLLLGVAPRPSSVLGTSGKVFLVLIKEDRPVIRALS